MTRSATFRKTDVTRLVRAIEATGKSVSSVEIDPDGRIVAKCAGAGEQPANAANPWDEVLNNGQEDRPAG